MIAERVKRANFIVILLLWIFIRLLEVVSYRLGLGPTWFMMISQAWLFLLLVASSLGLFSKFGNIFGLTSNFLVFVRDHFTSLLVVLIPMLFIKVFIKVIIKDTFDFVGFVLYVAHKVQNFSAS